MTGAYAVNALSDQERAHFESHLADCPACAREVRELTATASRLGLTVAKTPPPRMRERVLRRVTTVRQDPPQASPDAGGAGGASGRPARVRPPGGARRRLPRLALAACVAATAAFGSVAAWQYQSAEDAKQQSQRAQQRSDQLAEVLSAPDATAARSALPDGARGRVVVSPSQDRAVFLASGLSKPPDGKVYQLWFADGDAMRPAGVMEEPTASKAVLMQGSVGTAEGMGITVEPAGGSAQPTSKPLVETALPTTT